MTIDGVIFDLGGVVFDSPIHRIAAFESETGLPGQAVAEVIASNGDAGAWNRFERGELDRGEFLEAFADEFTAAGLHVDTVALLSEIEGAFVVRPSMVEAVDRLRSAGLVVAALTNNWTPMAGLTIASHFDVFVESVVEGCRKPEPEIYHRTVRRMGVEPDRVAMLDDLGENLKTARALGMATHKVVDPGSALRWLGTLVPGVLDDGGRA